MSKPNPDTRAPRPVQAPRRRDDPRRLPWKGALAAAALAALLAASFVLPPLFEDQPPETASAAHGHAQAAGSGDGPDLGTVIRFDERDAVTGASISSRSLEGKKTLLFFSEGVMCQACFVQIRALEQVGDALREKGVSLISITPDSPEILRQAIEQYGIRTPMIADDDRDMSAAFDTLGRGMHSDTPGHAFVLLDGAGKVVWQRDYWLEPYRTMYVAPAELLRAVPIG